MTEHRVPDSGPGQFQTDLAIAIDGAAPGDRVIYHCSPASPPRHVLAAAAMVAATGNHLLCQKADRRIDDPGVRRFAYMIVKGRTR